MGQTGTWQERKARVCVCVCVCVCGGVSSGAAGVTPRVERGEGQVALGRGSAPACLRPSAAGSRVPVLHHRWLVAAQGQLKPALEGPV